MSDLKKTRVFSFILAATAIFFLAGGGKYDEFKQGREFEKDKRFFDAAVTYVLVLDQNPEHAKARKALARVAGPAVKEKLAVVEVSSEDDAFPVEYALLPGKGTGWRASVPGRQIIRLLFDDPQRIQRISLDFEEVEIARTQEIVLRWSRDNGQSCQEIIRQQWNFSPEGATREIEDYHLELPEVTTLELSINPDISGSKAYASLKKLRLA